MVMRFEGSWKTVVSRLGDIGKRLLTDAASYWERMRILYNLVLATLAIVCWGPEMLSGRPIDFIGGMVVLSLFAIPANLCFCAAYPIDFVFQLTPLRAYLRPCRLMLLVCGTCLASASALWVLLGDHMA